MDPSELLKLFGVNKSGIALKEYTNYTQEELAALLSTSQIKIQQLTIELNALKIKNKLSSDIDRKSVV
jgi:hypothetical protein